MPQPPVGFLFPGMERQDVLAFKCQKLNANDYAFLENIRKQQNKTDDPDMKKARQKAMETIVTHVFDLWVPASHYLREREDRIKKGLITSATEAKINAFFSVIDSQMRPLHEYPGRAINTAKAEEWVQRWVETFPLIQQTGDFFVKYFGPPRYNKPEPSTADYDRLGDLFETLDDGLYDVMDLFMKNQAP